MTRTRTIHDVRRASAARVFAALGSSPSEESVLAVHCAAGHHVAAVYDTPSGPLYVSVPWAHSHGDRDRHDAAHHGGHRDDPWMDWLLPDDSVSIDDPLPAGCECGKRILSRARLLAAMDEGETRIIID